MTGNDLVEFVRNMSNALLAECYGDGMVCQYSDAQIIAEFTDQAIRDCRLCKSERNFNRGELRSHEIFIHLTHLDEIPQVYAFIDSKSNLQSISNLARVLLTNYFSAIYKLDEHVSSPLAESLASSYCAERDANLFTISQSWLIHSLSQAYSLDPAQTWENVQHYRKTLSQASEEKSKVQTYGRHLSRTGEYENYELWSLRFEATKAQKKKQSTFSEFLLFSQQSQQTIDNVLQNASVTHQQRQSLAVNRFLEKTTRVNLLRAHAQTDYDLTVTKWAKGNRISRWWMRRKLPWPYRKNLKLSDKWVREFEVYQRNILNQFTTLTPGFMGHPGHNQYASIANHQSRAWLCAVYGAQDTYKDYRPYPMSL